MTAKTKPPSGAGSRRDTRARASKLPTDRRRLHEWIRRNLYVAVVCDVLDELGYLDQAMHQRLRPLDPAHCTIVGRARTFRWMETHYIVPEDPYGLEIAAMDSLGHDDVAIHSADASGTIAPWGELMSTLAQRNGAAGCVCDALIRDCRKIVKLGFPVFHAGIRPLNSMGRAKVMAYDVPVKCGGVLVMPGDLIFADYDGVVVVPARIEAEALRRAAAKVAAENATRRELRKGRTLRDVYDEYHTL